MDNTIAYNDAQDWLIKNEYECTDNYRSTNGKTYFEYRTNAGLIYRLSTPEHFDSCEQELFINYMKGNTKMKTSKKFIAEIEFVVEINGSDIPEDIAEDIADQLDRNQEGSYSCADLDVSFGQVISVKETTNNKTTFTLQDILSIKKDTWLKFIKKHMTEDQIKYMEERNNDWHKISLNGRRELDKYIVFTGNYYNYADGEQSSKTIYLNFYKDLLFMDASFLNDDCYEYYANKMESCPEAGLLELMKIINKLVIVLYNLDAGDPLAIANRVVEMLNELMNS